MADRQKDPKISDLGLRRRPTQKRAKKRISDILEAADNLLAEGDINSLTTTRVAERAGVPVGVVYHYFTNIEAVLIELLQRSTQRMLEEVFEELSLAVEENLSWRAANTAMVDALAKTYWRHPGYLELRRGAGYSKPLDDIIKGEKRRAAQVLAERIVALGGDKVSGLEEAYVIARTGIEAATSLVAFGFASGNPERILTESKRQLNAYMSTYLDH